MTGRLITPGEVEHVVTLALPVAPSSTAGKRAIREVVEALEQDGDTVEERVARDAPLSADGADKLRRAHALYPRLLPADSEAHDVGRRPIKHVGRKPARMGSSAFIAMGPPIGSVYIESATENTIAHRIERSGMRWSIDSGQRSVPEFESTSWNTAAHPRASRCVASARQPTCDPYLPHSEAIDAEAACDNLIDWCEGTLERPSRDRNR